MKQAVLIDDLSPSLRLERDGGLRPMCFIFYAQGKVLQRGTESFIGKQKHFRFQARNSQLSQSYKRGK